jgi:predicted Zn-dependent protease
MMSAYDPYKVLGISPNATDEEVKEAYRELARKYHPDNYTNNPLSDLAEEKMQEINEAYDMIVKMRRQGGYQGNAGGAGGYQGDSKYYDIRNMINAGRILDAEMLLDGIPPAARNAEWHYLKGSVLYRKGWLESAHQHFMTAVQMEPSNMEYRNALNKIDFQRRSGGYRTDTERRSDGCSGCDVCTGLICADCCCECMGGDLIRCI